MESDALALAAGELQLGNSDSLTLSDLTLTKPELIGFVRSVLGKIMHAKACLKAKAAEGPQYSCFCSDCHSYIDLLSHLRRSKCTSSDRSCNSSVPEATCFSVSAILTHFFRCLDSECPLCAGFEKDSSVVKESKLVLLRRRAQTYAGPNGRAEAPIVPSDRIGGLQIRELRHQLSLIKHAQNCSDDSCSDEYCASVKAILTHIQTCRLGSSCQVQQCNSCRRLLYHCSNCTSSECQVCSSGKSRDSSPPSGSHEAVDITAAEDLLRLNRGRTVPSASVHDDDEISEGNTWSSASSFDQVNQPRRVGAPGTQRPRAVSAPAHKQPFCLAPNSKQMFLSPPINDPMWMSFMQASSSFRGSPMPFTAQQLQVPLQPNLSMPGYVVVRDQFGQPMLMPPQPLFPPFTSHQ